MAWFNYETCYPAVRKDTKANLFKNIINAYNSGKGIKGTPKEFECGYISSNGQAEMKLEIGYDVNYLDILRNICGSTLYPRIRREENGMRFIDLVRIEDMGTENEQYVQLGENLLDYVRELNTSWMVNVVYPYGAETETELFEGCYVRVEGDPVANQESIDTYGRIAKNIIWDGVTDRNVLKEQAENYLKQNAQPRVTLDMNALDLSEYGMATSKLDLGDMIQVIAKPFGIDQWIRVIELKIDLQDASKTKFTLSSNEVRKATFTNAIVEELETIPKKSELLDGAKRNAVALLQGANGGYLSFIFNEQKQMTGFQITNTKDINQATKKWVWNENGLGFMFYDYNPDTGLWEWTTNNAMTSDGSIVADMITTGTLSCDRLNGGEIKGQKIVGGSILGTDIGNVGNGNVSIFSVDANFTRGTRMRKDEFRIYDNGITDRNGWFQICGWRYGLEDGGGPFLALGSTACASRYGGIYYGDINTPCPSYGIVKAGYEATSGSDERLKQDIKDISTEYAKELINGLKPKEYAFKRNPNQTRYGLIAQDVRKTLDEMGEERTIYLEHELPDEYRTIEYSELISPMVKYIQDLQNQIYELKSEMEELKGQI